MCSSLNEFVNTTPPPTHIHTQTHYSDVNVAFQQAMLKVNIEKEELMKQFQLTLPQTRAPRGDGGRGEGVKEAWQLLGMSHTVEWPLHILFTPLILEK